jgi:hypothetical protein
MNEVFNPEQSAQNLKNKINTWNTLTLDIVEELSDARKFYSKQGQRNDLTYSQNGKKLTTWLEYLKEVGLPKTTAYNWLERYLPEEHKLLTPEELEDRKTQEENARRESAKSEYQKSLDRVAQYRKTALKSEQWGPVEEKLLQEALDYDRRIKEAKARNAEKEKQEEETRIKDQEGEKLTGELFSMLDASTAKYKERQGFKEAIRVSSEGQEDPFVDAIMDYLDTLESDSRKIEACHNIIKVCKKIATDLQANK